MHSYLIIVKRKEDYHSGQHEEIWLPTTIEEIEQCLHRLGCSLAKHDFDVVYSGFGYAEIDNKVHRYSDILALNQIAKLLQDFNGTPGSLCAELVYKDCEDEYEVVTCLSNRSKLVVLEQYKDITDYGKFCFYKDFWESDLCKRMNYQQYEDDLYYDASYPLWKRFNDCAMEHLKGKSFHFTPYGLVYEDATPCEEFDAPKSFGDIVVPF